MTIKKGETEDNIMLGRPLRLALLFRRVGRDAHGAAHIQKLPLLPYYWPSRSNATVLNPAST